VLLAYAALTITRNEIWKSPVTLWGESVDLAPRHYRPRLLLGEALEDVGRSDEAATEYNTAIELRPSEPTGYVKLGQLMANRGRFREARQHFREALRVAPNNEDARRSLVVLDQMTLQVTVDDAHR
jgi:Flp pilus assembly protein TadD